MKQKIYDPISLDQWKSLGEKLFETKDKGLWLFRCPACDAIILGKEWKRLKAKQSFAYSCIGRYMDISERGTIFERKQPCNYAGGGLFRLNPVQVEIESEPAVEVFAFAHENFEIEINKIIKENMENLKC